MRITRSKCFLFFVAVVTLLCVMEGADAHGGLHTCVHDTLVKPDPVDVVQPSTQHRKAFHVQSSGTPAESVRIQYFFNVDGSGACTSINQNVTTYQNAYVLCRNVDVLTAAMQSYILLLLSKATTKLSSVLNVSRLTSPLMPGTACGAIDISANASGLPNTDYVIYSTAVPTPTPGNTLAWAYGCTRDISTRRLIVGHVNFVPSVLTNAAAMDPVVLEQDVYTAVHEATHAFGFSHPFFNNGVVAGDGTLNASDTGLTSYFHPTLKKNVTRMNSPRVLAVARQFYNCTSLDGVEIEDGGGTGTKGSHWEKRILASEFMNGIRSTVKAYVTDFTVAFFEDAGLYIGNYNNTETKYMSFGRNTSCDVCDGLCNSTANKARNLYCWSATPSGGYGCTQDRMALGYCYLSQQTGIPSYQQYFNDPTLGGLDIEDYCPFVQGYSNTVCVNSSIPYDPTTGQNYTASSRCFDSNLMAKQSGSPATALDARCLGMSCLPTGQIVITLADAQALCPSDGSAGAAVYTSATFAGTIMCPPFWELCGWSVGAQTAATPVPPPTTTLVPTDTSTTAASPVTTTASPVTTTASPVTTTPSPVTTTASPGTTTASPGTTTASPVTTAGGSGTGVPTTIVPATSDPSSASPTTLAPTSAVPSTLDPTTFVPTTLAPTSAVPSTLVPTTVAPTSVVPSTLAPTTAIPTTSVPTPAPTMNTSSNITRQTSISGNWSLAISSNKSAVMTAAQQFLNTALPNASVTVTDVLSGSLIMQYVVRSSYTTSGIDGLIAQAPLTNLQTAFQALTGQTTPLSLLQSGPVTNATVLSSNTAACSSGCVAIVVVGVVVLVTIIVLCCCCKKKQQVTPPVKEPTSANGTSVPTQQQLYQQQQSNAHAMTPHHYYNDHQHHHQHYQQQQYQRGSPNMSPLAHVPNYQQHQQHYDGHPYPGESPAYGQQQQQQFYAQQDQYGQHYNGRSSQRLPSSPRRV